MNCIVVVASGTLWGEKKFFDASSFDTLKWINSKFDTLDRTKQQNSKLKNRKENESKELLGVGIVRWDFLPFFSNISPHKLHNLKMIKLSRILSLNDQTSEWNDPTTMTMNSLKEDSLHLASISSVEALQQSWWMKSDKAESKEEKRID